MMAAVSQKGDEGVSGGGQLGRTPESVLGRSATPTEFASDEVRTSATAADLIRALNNPIRRSVLRFLQSNARASSTEIRRGIPGSVGNNLNHHLEILVTTRAVRRDKQAGHRESFYTPTEAIRAPWCLTALKLSAEEDSLALP